MVAIIVVVVAAGVVIVLIVVALFWKINGIVRDKLSMQQENEDHFVRTNAHGYYNDTPLPFLPVVYDKWVTKPTYHEAYICAWTPST